LILYKIPLVLYTILWYPLLKGGFMNLSHILLDAYQTGNLEGIRWALKSGADANEILSWGSVYKFLPMVKLAIENGANPQNNENHALKWACMNGDLELVKYLVESGADAHADEDLPLVFAMENGYLDVVDYLQKI